MYFFQFFIVILVIAPLNLNLLFHTYIGSTYLVVDKSENSVPITPITALISMISWKGKLPCQICEGQRMRWPEILLICAIAQCSISLTSYRATIVELHTIFILHSESIFVCISYLCFILSLS